MTTYYSRCAASTRRLHSKDGGVLECVYDGGQWYSICSRCHARLEACHVCKHRPYPDPVAVLFNLPRGLFEADLGDDGAIYRCTLCDLVLGQEAVYRAAEHVSKAHPERLEDEMR